jgi:hypothetical protein
VSLLLPLEDAERFEKKHSVEKCHFYILISAPSIGRFAAPHKFGDKMSLSAPPIHLPLF